MFVARDFSAVWFFSAEVERKRERERERERGRLLNDESKHNCS